VTLTPASGPAKLAAMEAVDTSAKPSSEDLIKVFIWMFPLVKKKTFSRECIFYQLIKYS
jgi:hypothetical protein